MSDDSLRDEIHKRFTLNWLIQGAAQHAGMTFHHLVREELDALDPRLLRLYDQYALINLLQYWHADALLIFGWPPRFWKRARSRSSHPFYGHPLLPRYGGMLAATSRQRALDRCQEKGIIRFPFVFPYKALYVTGRLGRLEAPHHAKLIELAKKSASTIWGIPIERLDGDLARDFRFGTPVKVRGLRAALLRACTVGLGGVERRGDSLFVVGRGTNWQLLTKELVKGTAELICLHGLNRLSDDVYRSVMDAADRLELEPWMLQTGGELWRRLLQLMPDGRPLAHVLMCMARLPPRSLHSLIEAVFEQPDWARELLVKLRYDTGLPIEE
jgi:hypothetical protein